MNEIQVNSNPEVKVLLESYPEQVEFRLNELRNLILEAASELDGLDKIEETLKWGEPSYLAKNGSTLRIDWKEKNPDHFAMFFKCTSKLVPTFKFIYGDTFVFEGNRAIVFGLEESIPKSELKNCIKSALQYHKVKHLPNLGM